MNVWTHLIGFVVCFVAFIILCCTEVGEEMQDKAYDGVRVVNEAIKSGQVFHDLNWFEYQKNEFVAFMSELEYYVYQDAI
jgi:hypothetical protein